MTRTLSGCRIGCFSDESISCSTFTAIPGVSPEGLALKHPSASVRNLLSSFVAAASPTSWKRADPTFRKEKSSLSRGTRGGISWGSGTADRVPPCGSPNLVETAGLPRGCFRAVRVKKRIEAGCPNRTLTMCLCERPQHGVPVPPSDVPLPVMFEVRFAGRTRLAKTAVPLGLGPVPHGPSKIVGSERWPRKSTLARTSNVSGKPTISVRLPADYFSGSPQGTSRRARAVRRKLVPES